MSSRFNVESLSLPDYCGTWQLMEPRHPLCYYRLVFYTLVRRGLHADNSQSNLAQISQEENSRDRIGHLEAEKKAKDLGGDLKA